MVRGANGGKRIMIFLAISFMVLLAGGFLSIIALVMDEICMPKRPWYYQTQSILEEIGLTIVKISAIMIGTGAIVVAIIALLELAK